MNINRPFIRFIAAAAVALTALSANAASFKVLHTFQATFGTNDGKNSGGLIQPSTSTYYGMTEDGGPSFYGEVYRMNTAGAVKVLHAFDSTASYPQGELVDGKDGFYYGVVKSTSGASGNSGAVFKMTPKGAVTFIHYFTSTEGSSPASLIMAPDGLLYGILSNGGSHGDGVFFRMTRDGVYSEAYGFDSTMGKPFGVPATTGDGNFYISSYGIYSTPGCNCPIVVGGIYRLTYAAQTTMQIISTEKSNGRLLVAIDGNLYGTDATGGVNAKGSVFRMDRAGQGMTVIYSFTGGADGGAPAPALVYDNGYFYGTTTTGGPSNGGTIFKLSPAGAYGLMHSFDPNGGTGGIVTAPLMVSAQAKLIGASQASGSNGGSVFQQTP